MKDFEQLTDEEQQEVIMQIGSKLDKQEMWYWMGLVHLLREKDRRIKKALELIYTNAYDTERKECIDDLWGNIEELVDILEGNDV